MNKVLVAVSSISASEKMLNPVLALASRLGGVATIVHVATPRVGEADEDLRQRAYQAVTVFKEQLLAGGVTAEAKVLFASNPATAIVDLAAEQQASMIILGVTGKGVFARMLAGNVPMEIIKQSPVPVLMVPPDWDGRL